MTQPKQLNQDPARVKSARENTRPKLSQAAVSRHLGISRSLVCEIEGGTRNASPDVLRGMARLYKVPVRTLRAGGMDEPGGTAEASADVDLSDLRGGERAEQDNLPQQRRSVEASATTTEVNA
jgi:transcriptional regulator with XRE-family HTH domain